MLPKLVPLPDGVMRRLGHGVIWIPTLMEVDTTILKISRGEVNALGKVERERRPRQRRYSAGGLFIANVTLL
jgi:hypothetical protein